MKQYKFKIHYISDKENVRADAFNRKCDYMKSKKKFNHNILKINENDIISANHHQINAILRIIKDEKKQFFVSKKRLQILKNKIDEYIKKHHDDSLQKHSEVSKTIQLLRQYYQFSQIKQKVETYIKKCISCQKNKHATHVKYKKI